MSFWSCFKEACMEIADDILNVLEMRPAMKSQP